ncbi:MAG: mechanosensitive ion channel family protein [Haloferacaceae archaeon]
MADPLQAVPSPPQSVALRTALTLGLVVVVVAVRYLAGKWQSNTDAGGRSALRLAVSAGVSLATGAGVVALVYLWNLVGPLRASLESLGLENLAGKLLLSGVILAGTYALTSFIGRVIGEVTGSRNAISEHEREIIYRLTQVALYTVAVLVVVGLFTKDLGSLLVGAGFLGIIIGMAARQTLGAVLAGFVLMFSRPFEIGDWVEIGDQDGIVTDITIVNTRIQTFEGEYVILPNDTVSGRAITNRTRKGRLRLEVEVGVDYDDDPRRAADVALDTVEDVDGIMPVPAPQVVMKRFADSAVVLGVRFWIDNPSARRQWRARTRAIEAIKAAFEAEGIKIPFPQRELMARAEAGGFSVAEGRETPATADGGDGGGDGG